ncbi:MAG: trimethylamine methyltransferase family protein [Chloroflexota bacterium]
MSRPRKRSRKQNRQQSPYFNINYQQETRNPWPPMEIASTEQVEQIHEASMTILENTGLRFMDEEALDLWETAGAKVDRATQHVWLDRGLIMSLVDKAPSSFTWQARNPARNRFLGENSINNFPPAGMVFVRDCDRGRRPGMRDDLITLAKLNQMTNIMHFAPMLGIVMHDVPVPEKHLQHFLIGATFTDKVQMGTTHGRIITKDVVEMAKIIFGGEDKSDIGPITGGIINVNSPLVYDDRMLGGMITMAKHGQVVIVTPFILAGAMSPITILGTVAQQNAEALAGIALLQLVRPGTPVIYGGFTTNVDMKSGGPAFGTPEGAWALLLGAQLARHYGVPYRGSGSLNTANIPDAQAAAETQWSLWPCILSHTNFIAHSVGWLESGLTVSLEKYVMDVESVAMMQHFLHGPTWDRDSFALDEIHEVGPAGHHFGTAHTQARYQTAFYPPFLHDRRNLGTWEEAGSEDIVQRANKLWKSIIDRYEPPPMDIAIKEALTDYVARRTEELKHVDLYD